jgi:hypothetical protein
MLILFHNGEQWNMEKRTNLANLRLNFNQFVVLSRRNGERKAGVPRLSLALEPLE